MKGEKVILPKELTAENGAKGLLMGEFFEEIKVKNPEWCYDDCDRSELADCGKCTEVDAEDKEEYLTQKVSVSWTTIKEIYKMTVKGLSQPIGVNKICCECNKEFLLKSAVAQNDGEIITTFENCPHCGERNDTWLRISSTQPIEGKK